MSAWKFRKGEEGNPIRWVRIGTMRWPLAQPPDELDVQREANVDLATLGGKVGPLHVSENRAFPLGGMLLPTSPTLAIAFPDPLEHFSGPGFKPLFRDVAGLAPRGMSLFQWGALPANTSSKPPRPIGNEDVFTLLADSYVESGQPPSDDAPASIRVQVDVLSVAYGSGLPEHFLLTPSGVGMDTTGDAGLRQGVAEFEGAIRTWRSRRYAARGSWVAPEEPPARRSTTFMGLASDRFLPAPQTSRDQERRTGQEFPRNIALAVMAVLLLLICATRR